jgi:molybdate transport system regulatory protein
MAARLFIRVDLAPNGRVGPGKIALLEAIERTGSISAAGRASRMSYRRAWLLVDELNALFARPVVATHTGGPGGGGAALTPLGHDLVARFRLLERRADSLRVEHLGPIEAALAPARPAAEP